MTFQVTQISDVGTSNPIVARLTVGLFELIDMAGSKLGKEKSDEIKSLCFEIKKALVQAEKSAKPLMDEIKAIETKLAEEGIQVQSGGRAINTPGVITLDNSKVFLKFAKQALQTLAKALGILLDKDFNGPRFDLVRDHAIKKLGASHIVSKLLVEDQTWIKEIIDLRNEDEHPNTGKEFIRGYNISKTKEGPYIVNVPRFFNDSPVLNRLEVFSHNLLTFSEEMLAHNLVEYFPDIVTIYDIPEDQRKSEMPVRYRVGLKEGIRIPSSN